MRHLNHQRLNPYLSGVLAVWILVLSLAGVSPALHSWMHGSLDAVPTTCGGGDCSEQVPQADEDDSGQGAHFCGVTALHVGALTTVPVFLPEVALLKCGEFSLPDDVFCGARASSPYQARAPPIENLV